MPEGNFTENWRVDLHHGVMGVQLAEVDHPLEIYVGSSDLGRPRLQIRSHTEAHMPELSDLILVDRARFGNIHTFTLTLVDDAYVNVFMVLAEDIIRRTRDAQDETSALDRAAAILAQWQRLLRPRHLRRLSLDALRGLVGELWLVLNHFSHGRTLHESVVGWQGPLGLPQDFWYAESGFHEAKAIGPSASSVKISSAQQLDEPDMELLALRVPQVSGDAPGAFSLRQLVDEVIRLLKAEGRPEDDVLLRITSLGVDLEDQFYRENCFTVDSITAYKVCRDFPAIRTSGLPLAVNQVRYSLTLSALDEFKIGSPWAPTTKNGR